MKHPARFLLLVLLAIASPGFAADSAIENAIKGEHRSAMNKVRDESRHPAATLEFFGFRHDMTVIELWPGGGWYTGDFGTCPARQRQAYRGKPTAIQATVPSTEPARTAAMWKNFRPIPKSSTLSRSSLSGHRRTRLSGLITVRTWWLPFGISTA